MKKEMLYYLYDMKDNECLVFVGNIRELCEYLGMTRNVIHSALGHGCNNFKRRYKLIKEWSVCDV